RRGARAAVPADTAAARVAAAGAAAAATAVVAAAAATATRLRSTASRRWAPVSRPGPFLFVFRVRPFPEDVVASTVVAAQRERAAAEPRGQDARVPART